MTARLRTMARWAAGTTLLMAAALMAGGQSAPVHSAYELGIGIQPTSARAEIQPAGEVLREIDDPSTGDRWLLVRGISGGPGRLVLAGHSGSTRTEADREQAKPAPEAEMPVIHAGDRLIVEEHTTVVDARLEAMALNPALVGASFAARLTIGGNVVRVRAIAPGRALLEPAGEGMR